MSAQLVCWQLSILPCCVFRLEPPCVWASAQACCCEWKQEAACCFEWQQEAQEKQQAQQGKAVWVGSPGAGMPLGWTYPFAAHTQQEQLLAWGCTSFAPFAQLCFGKLLALVTIVPGDRALATLAPAEESAGRQDGR